MSPEARSYAAGPTLLSLEGIKAGFVKSVEGGAVTADVIEEPAGATPFTKKHLGQTRYEDIIVGLTLSTNRTVYDWIRSSWEMKDVRKNGSLTFCDYNLKATSSLEFFNALITEVTIPACDAASKDAAFLKLRISPEFSRFASASGTVKVESIDKSQKSWVPSSFALTIDELDCNKVSKIDPITVKRTLLFDEIGEEREVVKEPSRVEFPNLRVTLSEAGAQSWLAWHEDFVLKGNNEDDQERDGRLEFLTPTKKDEFLALNLFNLGIFRIAPDKSEATKDQLKRVTADLYCERMELDYPASG
jgi:phage tail-like protein